MATRTEFERAIVESDLPAPTRLILLTLATRVRPGTLEIKGADQPTEVELVELTGLALRTVQNHTRIAERAGLLACARRRRTGTQYTPLVPERERPTLVPVLTEHQLALAAAALATVHGWTPDWCRQVARDVLARAKGCPQDPARYVLTAVSREPHRYRPTITPGALGAECEHGDPHGGARCIECQAVRHG